MWTTRRSIALLLFKKDRQPMRRLLTALSRWWTALRKRGGDIVDTVRLQGRVEFRLIHAHGPNKGQVHRVIKGRNIVTSWLSVSGAAPTSGRDLMRRILVPNGFSGQLSSDPNATISQLALGSGTTAETSADTDLEATIPGSLKSLSSVDFDSSNPYVTFIFEYAEGEVNTTISEAGLYSGRTPPDFVARKTFGSFTKTSDFTLQVRWQIRF
jgi:hypothetical protein